MISIEKLKLLVEAILFVQGKPISEKEILQLFTDEEKPNINDLRKVLINLMEEYNDRGIELVHVASGYQFQSKAEYAKWIGKLWQEKPSKYSKALLETLALIAYKQPVTRGEIEDIRGVSISSSIFKTLQEERGWIRVVGHKDVPGRPGLYATTPKFLDYFGLDSLDKLPSLPQIMNLEGTLENGTDNKEQLEINFDEQAISEQSEQPQENIEIEQEQEQEQEAAEQAELTV